MRRFFAAIARFSVRFRWLVLAVWVAGLLAAQAAPNLSDYVQGNDQAFLPSSSLSVQAARLAAPFGASGMQPVEVVAVRPAGLTPADTSELAALAGSLLTVPGVSKTAVLGRSADGRAGLLLAEVQVSGGMMSGQAQTLVTAIRAKIAAAHLPAGLITHLAGDLAAQADSAANGGSNANGILNIAAIFILLLLFVVFRSLLAPLITLVPAFGAVTISSALVAVAAQHGMRISAMAQILLIVLVLGAGSDYGLFLIFRVREELRAGADPKDAVVSALTRVGEAVTFSAATVLAALASLLAATFPLYRDMATPLLIGIGVMLLAGLTLLPALLAIFGRAAFWPARPSRPGAREGGAWGRLSARLLRRPVAVLAGGVVVFGALAAASVNYKAGDFGGQTAPWGSDSAAGGALLAKYFPQAAANPTNIVFRLPSPAWDEAAAIGSATTELESSAMLRGVSGPLDPAGTALPAASLRTPATAEYVSPDGHTIQFAVGLVAGDPGSTAAMNAVPAVRAEADRVAAVLHATRWGVTGQAPATYDVSHLASGDLARVIPLAVVIIAVLLGLVLRSLVAPWYLIASVVLSYFASLGAATLVFIDIGGANGVVFFLPTLMFLFLLALGEDYNILVMTRIREEAHTLPLPEAVSRALVRTGSTVTSAGLILAGTFAVFAIVGGQGSGGGMVIDIGVGIATGILLDTFVVRTLLVPAAVLLLGRWNWWPSALSARRDSGENAPAHTAAASR
jgi:RND superfamily putative drug exporter